MFVTFISTRRVTVMIISIYWDKWMSYKKMTFPGYWGYYNSIVYSIW